MSISITSPIISVQDSPFGLQVRGRYYRPHSAISERADWEEQGFSRSPRSFSNGSYGSSHASHGSANSDESNGGDGYSTSSTPPREFVKMSFIQDGDVSDNEGLDASGISPETFLKLTEGCATGNRHFRVGGPAKVEVSGVSLFLILTRGRHSLTDFTRTWLALAPSRLPSRKCPPSRPLRHPSTPTNLSTTHTTAAS